MKSFNRYETVGIVVSIAAVIGVLVASRFFPLSFLRNSAESDDTETARIITIDPGATDDTSAVRQALLEGSTGNGRITTLIIQDTTIGTGRTARLGDTVTIHYIAKENDAGEFDNTYTKGTPLSFKVGADEVIEGLEQGIIGMKEGGKRILVIPSDMGYGDIAVAPLPANATLLFSVELLTIE